MYILLGVLLVFLILALLFYYQLRTSGFQIKTGNVVIDIKYNNSISENKADATTNNSEINSSGKIGIDELNNTLPRENNISASNSSLTYQNLSN